jgi:GT2 family glycosyltransferase
MTSIAAVIIGIDGWERYTKPLRKSLLQHEPEAWVIVVDNASEPPYPQTLDVDRTKRLCYSAAINHGARLANTLMIPAPDWLVILSNDVLCTGPFAHMLAALPDDRIAGPEYTSNMGYNYLMGWCVCIPRRVWDAVGGWDENFRMASWEDVDYAYMTREAGYHVTHMPELPFTHLDQRQRHAMPTFWQDDLHNFRYFSEKRERVQLTPGWRRLPQAVTA